MTPPSASKENKRWNACFRPYVKHRRKQMTAAEAAVDFQKSKDYEGGKNEQETNLVDDSFVNSTVQILLLKNENKNK